eukprot:553933_1
MTTSTYLLVLLLSNELLVMNTCNIYNGLHMFDYQFKDNHKSITSSLSNFNDATINEATTNLQFTGLVTAINMQLPTANDSNHTNVNGFNLMPTSSHCRDHQRAKVNKIGESNYKFNFNISLGSNTCINQPYSNAIHVFLCEDPFYSCNGNQTQRIVLTTNNFGSDDEIYLRYDEDSLLYHAYKMDLNVLEINNVTQNPSFWFSTGDHVIHVLQYRSTLLILCLLWIMIMHLRNHVKFYIILLFLLSSFNLVHCNFELSYKSNTLSTSGWVNNGTLIGKDITSFTGYIHEITTNNKTINAMCWNSSNAEMITFIDYNTNPSVNPELTMEIAVYQTEIATKHAWLLGNDNSGLDRAIIVWDDRYDGIAAGSGSAYASTVSYGNLNEWTHIVITWSVSSGKATIYKNGGTLSNGEQQEINAVNSDGYTRIGLNGLERVPTTNHFIGCVSQVQITNSVKTSAEIKLLYDQFVSSTSNSPTQPTVVCSTFNETLNGEGTDYVGCQNITINSNICQQWSTVGGVHGIWNHNYCRNPNGRSTIWCYINSTHTNEIWEYCRPTTYTKLNPLFITGIAPNPAAPQAFAGGYIGVWNNTIWLISGVGGFPDYATLDVLWSYNEPLVEDNNYQLHEPLGWTGYGGFSGSIQWNEFIFFQYDRFSPLLVSYNMQMNLFSRNITNNFVGYTANCLVIVPNNTMDTLVSIGGRNETNVVTDEVRAYNIMTGEWNQWPSLLNVRYGAHNCELVNEKIYTIAGRNLPSAGSQHCIDTIETLDISDVWNGWSSYPNTLVTPRRSFRSVVIDDKIYVIGGYGSTYLSSIEMIDTVSTQISIVAHLVQMVNLPRVAVMNDIFYVFGGTTDTPAPGADVATNILQYVCNEALNGQINGVDYRGCQSRTISNKICQKWVSHSPHSHDIYTQQKMDYFGIGDHNYCRNPNPGTKNTIWCYTMDVNTEWDYCDPLQTISSTSCMSQWNKIAGSLKQISIADDGTIWGVNTNGNIFYRDINTSSWQTVSGELDQISVGSSTEVWGVNVSSTNSIFYRNFTTDNWVQFPGELKYVSVGNDGTVWGVNNYDHIYYVNGSKLTKICGSLKQISVGSSAFVWGVDGVGDIYRRNFPTNSWVLMASGYQYVTVNGDGDVWALDNNNVIMHYNDSENIWIPYCTDLIWNPNIFQFETNAASIWGIDAYNHVYEGKANGSINYPNDLPMLNTTSSCDSRISDGLVIKPNYTSGDTASQCGVDVELTNDPRGINVITCEKEWTMKQMETNPLYDWSFKVALDAHQYGFKSGISTLSLEIEGHRLTNECDLFFAFSVGNNEYVTFATDIDGGLRMIPAPTPSGIFIYPPCDGNSVAFGDASTLIPSNNLDDASLRAALANDNINNFGQLTDVGNGNVSPLKFSFINNEWNDTFTVKFQSPTFPNGLNCTYNSMVSIEKAFKIFIVPDLNSNEQYTMGSLKITGTNIGYTFAPSFAPTRTPTMAPTRAPTVAPTRAPTQLCLSLYITVFSSNGSFIVDDFNGLYTMQSETKLNRQIWKAVGT